MVEVNLETFLKVLKLSKDIAPIVSAIMPLIVVLLTGWWLNNRLEKLKSRLQLDHSIIQKRADIYAEIQDYLNNIYSYIQRVGHWKELDPALVLNSKRKLDQEFHATKPYWSKNTFHCYDEFMNVCFQTYRAHGKDAGIVACSCDYKTLSSWSDNFEKSFVDGYDRQKLIDANNRLMDALSKDFGIV
jgi:hypothetical protein